MNSGPAGHLASSIATLVSVGAASGTNASAESASISLSAPPSVEWGVVDVLMS